DDQQCHDERYSARRRHQRSQHDDGTRDQQLATGQWHADDAERAAHRHDQRKAIGSSQIAGAPSSAPQIPTLTIAKRWSRPESGCRKPAANPAALPPAECAEAGAAKRVANAKTGTASAVGFPLNFTRIVSRGCP